MFYLVIEEIPQPTNFNDQYGVEVFKIQYFVKMKVEIFL